MKTFNCPDCLLQETTYDPENICDSCMRNLKPIPIIIQYEKLTPLYVIKPYANDDPCEFCPTNSKNGGSGICNCAIPYFHGRNKIT